MRCLVFIFAFIVFLINSSHAFELGGLQNDMSIEEARKVLEGYSYDKIELKGDTLIAFRKSGSSYPFDITATFCKGKLVQAQKHLNPRFNDFVRLVQQKTKELGKPLYAWTEPTDIESGVESNSVIFLWKNGPTFIKVTYIEFASNNQLDITYEIKNSCWRIPY
jgi:hypothetical protein